MALADDYPALVALYKATPPYSPASAGQVTALAGDVHKVLDEVRDVRAVVARYRAAVPFGPGYTAGYRRAIEDMQPLLDAADSDYQDLLFAVRPLVEMVLAFDPEAYQAADLIAMVEAAQSVAALLPALPEPPSVPTPPPAPPNVPAP
jgi:hypothetical protein